MPIWITEMGYETNPPDPFRGVSLAQQAAYENESDFMAYQQPRVAAVTQFLLEDAGPDKRYKRGTRGYWDTYQSGLEYGPGSGSTPGSRKPAYGAYALPFWISTIGTAASPQIDLWAWVRFRAFQPNSTDRVVFQFERQGTTTWVTDSPILHPNAGGFVNLAVPENAYGIPGSWRAVWIGPSGTYPAVSRDVAYPG
jgi:hypothetical protein